MAFIPFLRPNLVKKEAYLHYLDKIDESRIYSNYGPLNSEFESRVLATAFENQGMVTTVHNATVGLMLAIMKSKRSTGRYAIMPSFTFSATPLAAMWCGLTPYFVDVDPETYCMDHTMLREVLDLLGDQVAVVVPYAAFGTAMDLTFYEQLQDSGIPVVVDAAASFGTNGTNGQFGKGFHGMVVFSFHATKSFGVGEGGLIYSADKEAMTVIKQMGNFGFTENRVSEFQGLNSKIPEYTAAIALATLDVFPEKLKHRQRIFHSYQEEFETFGLFEAGWQFQHALGVIAHQFISVCCPSDQHNQKVVERLENQNIQARTYFSPCCHHQDLFRDFPRTSMSTTEYLSKHIVSLPLWEEMNDDTIQTIVRALV